MGHYFYADEDKKVVRENLLTDRAKVWAESFIRPEVSQDKRKRNPKLSSAQLRKFHNEAKALEAKVKTLKKPEEEFEKIRPLIKMLKSKVAYVCPSTGRDRKVPKEFRDYLEEMVDNIQDPKDFEAFALCFEAVVGFFYGEGGR